MWQKNVWCVSVDLEDSQLLAKKTGEENSALKTELEKAQETITEKSGMVIDLQGKDVCYPNYFRQRRGKNIGDLPYDIAVI